MKDYKVIESPSANNLSAKVCEMLKKGWELCGDITVVVLPTGTLRYVVEMSK